MHPFVLIITGAAALIYSAYLKGITQLRSNLIISVSVFLITLLLNILFNHQGVTVLFYMNQHPITLESVYFGLSAGLMLADMLIIFSIFNYIMTSDKIIILFHKLPVLSLLFTMALRLVPRYKIVAKQISQAQSGIGQGIQQGNIFDRIRHFSSIVSALVTYALENGIETANSMVSRGYGLSHRNNYFKVRWTDQDKKELLGMCLLLVGFIPAFAFGGLSIQFFPTWQLQPLTMLQILGLAAYALFCLLPWLLDIREEKLWLLSKGKN